MDKKMENLKYTINQLDLTDKYRTHHSAATEYTFFSILNETFFRNILQGRSYTRRRKNYNKF